MSAYWFWKQAVPKEVCELVLSQAKQQDWNQGNVGEREIVDSNIRKANVTFLPRCHWFEHTLYGFALYANKAGGWNYDLTYNQGVQIAEYENFGHYDFHKDGTLDSNGRPGFRERKLTAVCLLNEGFVGGDLELYKANVAPEHTLTNIGDLIVFPALHDHRVTPVTAGTRYSAVLWATGPFMR